MPTKWIKQIWIMGGTVMMLVICYCARGGVCLCVI